MHGVITLPAGINGYLLDERLRQTSILHKASLACYQFTHHYLLPSIPLASKGPFLSFSLAIWIKMHLFSDIILGLISRISCMWNKLIYRCVMLATYHTEERGDVVGHEVPPAGAPACRTAPLRRETSSSRTVGWLSPTGAVCTSWCRQI